MIIPVVCLILLAAGFTFIHIGIKSIIRLLKGEREENDVFELKQTSKTERRFPFFKAILCIVSISLGCWIIASNVPRTYLQDGIASTLFTSAVFFLPLIGLPFTLLVKIIKEQIDKPFVSSKSLNAISIIQLLLCFMGILLGIIIFSVNIPITLKTHCLATTLAVSLFYSFPAFLLPIMILMGIFRREHRN